MPYPSRDAVSAIQSRLHLPLSPRQRVDDQSSSLSANNVRGHRRNQSISLNYNPYEVQHALNLRVANRRSHSRSPARAGTPSLEHVIEEEPDFLTEERAVWSTVSPSPARHKVQPSADFTLYDEESPQSEHAERPDLRPFAPSRNALDINDRPKTSRGSLEHQHQLDELQLSPNKSRFLEGSMNARSAGISSVWSEQYSASEASDSEADDSDLTPQASELASRSILDLRDFDPPLSTPNALRRTLFRKRSKIEGSADVRKRDKNKKKSTHEGGDRSRMQLRKSLPSFNLHGLGGKIRLFNSSSSSVNTDSEDASHGANGSKRVFDDRKRKAEEAYAQQFGGKKHKDNADPIKSKGNNPSKSGPPMAARQKPDSHDPNATIRARHQAPCRRSIHSIHDLPDLNRKFNASDHDARKRPTRRELEKENQQLRAMLQESQNQASQQSSQAMGPPSELSDTAPMTKVDSSLQHPGRSKTSESNASRPPAESDRTLPHSASSVSSLEMAGSTHNCKSVEADPQLDDRVAQRVHGWNSLSPSRSLPALARAVVTTIFEAPDEGISCRRDEAGKQTNAKSVILRRSSRVAHSKQCTVKQEMTNLYSRKGSQDCDKENESTSPIIIPAIMINELSGPSGPKRSEDWKGWDDDVF